MIQGNSDHKGTEEQAILQQAFVPPYPFRHKSYNSAVDAIQTTLKHKNAVILQGPERTGKTTLITELKQLYQQQGIEVISFTSAVNTPRQLYGLLAEALAVPKLKKDLIAALLKAKQTGNYCLVIMDEAAVNSSAATSEALRKLCDPTSKTAGALKIIVVCTDYLVIHTKNTYETDFHDWINNIVPLHTLKAEELEALIHYLAGLKHYPPPQFEMGTDLELIQRSNGKIDHLISLLNPLIDETVISQSRFRPTEKNTHPLDSSKSKYYFLGAATVLVLLFGLLMREIIVPTVDLVEQPGIPEDAVIFKSDLTPNTQQHIPSVRPPVLDPMNKKTITTPVVETGPTQTSPATSPASVQTGTVNEPNGQQLDKIPGMIDQWLQARKEQHLEEYLQFYSQNLSGRTTADNIWRKKKEAHFHNEKLLQLKRANLNVEMNHQGEAQVEFWLEQINSKGAQSRIKKRLILNSDGKSWKIKEESDLRLVKKL